MNGKGRRQGMRKVTASDPADSQKRRIAIQGQKEQENSTTEDARARFRRKPYMGMYMKQDRCGNDLGGRG